MQSSDRKEIYGFIIPTPEELLDKKGLAILELFGKPYSSGSAQDPDLKELSRTSRVNNVDPSQDRSIAPSVQSPSSDPLTAEVPAGVRTRNTDAAEVPPRRPTHQNVKPPPRSQSERRPGGHNTSRASSNPRNTNREIKAVNPKRCHNDDPGLRGEDDD